MANIQMLRALISNGWTRQARQIFEQKLGKEQFDILKFTYSNIREGAPFVPQAIIKEKDIYLSLSRPIEGSGCPFDFSELPYMFRNQFQKGVQEFMDSFFPKFKNEEINIENIIETFQHLDFDKVGTEEALFKALGFNIKKESYKFSDLVKLKHVGNSATLQKDASYTSEIISDTNGFNAEIGKLFGISEKEIFEAGESCVENVKNFVIKQKGKNIGYFSIKIKNGELNVGNYVVYPEYRNSRVSMNAILTVRDRIIETAKQEGIKVVKADVDASNPQLLGLYKRFGFQPTEREILSFVDESGQSISSDTYNLIGYLC